MSLGARIDALRTLGYTWTAIGSLLSIDRYVAVQEWARWNAEQKDSRTTCRL